MMQIISGIDCRLQVPRKNVAVCNIFTGNMPIKCVNRSVRPLKKGPRISFKYILRSSDDSVLSSSLGNNHYRSQR